MQTEPNQVQRPEIEIEDGWLSWVISTSVCLKALGTACDSTDVAGFSSYAFALSINTGVCPSGPTTLEWSFLADGITLLGRSVLSYLCHEHFTPGLRGRNGLFHARMVFELAKIETEAGRPCVVLGLGAPEFGVVCGVERQAFLCVPRPPSPESVEYTELNAPGGPMLFSFPGERASSVDRDAQAIRRALVIARMPQLSQRESRGLDAYQAWIAALDSRRAQRFGAGYNAQCWAEARRHAATFLERVAARNPTLSSLSEAHEHFLVVAEQLKRVAELFPFRLGPGFVDDERAIAAGLVALRAAARAEVAALTALERAQREMSAATGALL